MTRHIYDKTSSTARKIVINTSPTMEGLVQVYEASDWTGAMRWRDEDQWIADVEPAVLDRILGSNFASETLSEDFRRISVRVTREQLAAIEDANVGRAGIFRSGRS